MNMGSISEQILLLTGGNNKEAVSLCRVAERRSPPITLLQKNADKHMPHRFSTNP